MGYDLPAVMRLLTRALHLAGRASHLASTTFHGCAASTLTLDELQAGIRARWRTFNERERDATGPLREWEIWYADRWIRPGLSVLVVGCGTGREIFALLARGCRVTGVDPVASALAIARRLLDDRGLSAELIEGSIADVPVPGRYDAIWFTWDCYSYIPEASRRIRTLERLALQLNAGGHVTISFQPDILRPRPIVYRAARLAGALAGADWRLEPGDLVGWAMHDGRPCYSYGHAFTPQELEREASLAGLRIVDRRDPPDDPVYVLQRAAG